MTPATFAGLLESGQLFQRIRAAVPEMLQAAQAEYDAWDQNEEGEDPELGGGGICDQIAQALGGVLGGAGVDTMEGGQPGDDHAYLIAYDDQEAYEIDIDPCTYERGGGYSWRKVPDVTFVPEDLLIHPINRADLDPDSAYD